MLNLNFFATNLQFALTRYERCTGNSFPCVPKASFSNTPEVIALTELYLSENWGKLRFLAYCSFAVMILIEQQERLNEEPQDTHPLAVTEIVKLNKVVSTELRSNAPLHCYDE